MGFVILVVIILSILTIFGVISDKINEYKKRSKNREKERYEINTERKKYPVFIETNSKLNNRKYRESYDWEEEPKKGEGERVLFNKMSSVFDSDKIYLGRVRFFPRGKMNFNKRYASDEEEKKRSYYPDITYLDKSKGLAIDIEVDEPYTYEGKDKKPIHYVYEWKTKDGLGSSDKKRNEKFIKHGWHVLRFSERQSKEEPLGCCGYICKILRYVGANQEHSFPSCRGLNSPPLQKDDRWTRGEATEVAR